MFLGYGNILTYSFQNIEAKESKRPIITSIPTDLKVLYKRSGGQNQQGRYLNKEIFK